MVVGALTKLGRNLSHRSTLGTVSTVAKNLSPQCRVLIPSRNGSGGKYDWNSPDFDENTGNPNRGDVFPFLNTENRFSWSVKYSIFLMTGMSGPFLIIYYHTVLK